MLNKKIISVITLIILSTLDFQSYCQSYKTDSLIISYMKAVKITDSINSPMPDSIRLLTIKYFYKSGLKPSEYYTTKDFQLEKEYSIEHIELCGVIELFRIGALRDLYYIETIKDSDIGWVGAAGGPGDDIIVKYNTTFNEIIEITHGE